jgi:hypothetical protein
MSGEEEMTIQQIHRQDRSPTLGQVADLAGVSIATASRVLNNSAPVSVQARQLVRDAVVRLGYVRHRAVHATGTMALGGRGGLHQPQPVLR